MSSRDRGPIPRPWLRGRQSGVTPDGACRRPNGDCGINIVWCSRSRRFPQPLQPQGPADPGPARSWTPQEKHVTESDPNGHPSARAERGGPVLAPAYCSSLLDLVYNNSPGPLTMQPTRPVPQMCHCIQPCETNSSGPTPEKIRACV
jgi:hypothetical protein